MPPPPSRTARLRIAAALVLSLIVLLGGWLWLRQSALVSVDKVVVTGASGPQAARVVAALQTAGRDMTTLRVRTDALKAAVAPYPVVRDVEAHGDFPHTLRVVVHERVPVGAITMAGARLPVAADGTVLRDTPADGVPVVAVKGEDRTRRAIAVLAGAPAELRQRIARLYVGPEGWTAPMISGPTLKLGSASRLAAKWAAAVAVLESPKSAGATYLDLRLPERPVAGGLLAPPTSPSTSGSGSALGP